MVGVRMLIARVLADLPGPCPEGMVEKAGTGLELTLPLWILGLGVALGCLFAIRIGTLSAVRGWVLAGLAVIGFFMFGAAFITNCLVCVPESRADEWIWGCSDSPAENAVEAARVDRL